MVRAPLTIARLRDEPQTESAPSATDSTNPVIPDPLRSYLGGDLDSLHWRMVAPRVHQIQIETADHRSKARLLRFHSGSTVPTHGHNGRELTLVLTGSLLFLVSLFMSGYATAWLVRRQWS